MRTRSIFTVGLLALLLLTAWASWRFAPRLNVPAAQGLLVPAPKVLAGSTETASQPSAVPVETQKPASSDDVVAQKPAEPVPQPVVTSPARLQLQRNAQGQVVLAGRLPDERAKRLVLARAGAQFGEDQFLDEIEVGPTEDASWLIGALLSFPPRMAAGDSPVMELTGNQVKVSGHFESESGKQALIDSFAAKAFGGLAVIDESQVRAPAPKAAPALSAAWDGEQLKLSGQLAAQHDLRIVLARARALYGADRVQSDIAVLDVDSPAWMDDLLRVFPPPLQQLAQADVRLHQGVITIDAQAASTVDRDLSLAALQGALGERVRIEDRIQVKAPPVPTPAVLAAVSEEHRAVQLEPVPSAAQAAAARGGPLTEEAMLAVTFYQGSARLTVKARRALDKLLDHLRADAGARFELAGFSDSRGDAQANLRLSQQRAQAVAAYLSAHGVDAERLDVSAHGEANPVGDNETVEGRWENRRVELRRLG